MSSSDIPIWVNPVEGVISSMAGLRENPVTKKPEFHDGLDIACPIGTEVRAVRSGTVSAVGESATFGRYVKLSFGDGYTVLYAHLSRSAVKENESVRQGQVVAYSGNTGRTTGPHLHYSVFLDGQYVNPAAYVRLTYDNEGLAKVTVP